ncbi:putative Chaperone SurA [Desulfovibrionales bacterium]
MCKPLHKRLILGRNLFISVLVIFLALAGQAMAKEIIDRIVATVNGKIITLSDLNKRLKSMFEKMNAQLVLPVQYAHTVEQYRHQILQSMIDDIVIIEEAERLKVIVTDADVEGVIRDIKERQNLTNEMFHGKLALEKMTRNEYATMIRQQLLKSRLMGYMVNKKVVATEDEARKYFEANSQKNFSDLKSNLHLELIMLPSSQKPIEIIRLIKSKKISFTEAARKYSVGPKADKGGDIGVFVLKDLGLELQQALNGLKEGDLSKPFKLEGKDAFVRVVNTDDVASSEFGDGQDFELVKQEIMKKIYEAKLEERLREYTEKLRRKAVIKINPD